MSKKPNEPARAREEAAAVWMSPSDLTPMADNPRKHTRQQVERIARSVERYGWTRPIVVDQEHVIIAGHGAWMAATSLGLERVPVRVINVSRAQRVELAAVENRLAEQSEWDDEIYQSLIDKADDELKSILDEEDAEPGETGMIEELQLGPASAEFWVIVRGPLALQPEALDALREKLESIEGLDVELGWEQ